MSNFIQMLRVHNIWTMDVGTALPTCCPISTSLFVEVTRAVRPGPVWFYKKNFAVVGLSRYYGRPNVCAWMSGISNTVISNLPGESII